MRRASRRLCAAAGLGLLPGLIACGLLPPEAPARQVAAPLALACQPIMVPGAEDVAIHAEASVAYLSSTDRRALFGQAPTAGPQGLVGHLFRLDLKQDRPLPEAVTPAALRDHDFQPHGLGLLPLGDGTARLFVINHRAPLAAGGPPAQGSLHTVEILDLPASGTGPLGVRRLGIAGPGLTNPNDIAPVGGDAFYVTNTDDGEGQAVVLLRAVLGVGGGGVAYFDGARFAPETLRIPLANGILADRGRGLLHVTSSADGLLRSYRFEPGQPPRLVATRPTGLRADNLALDTGPEQTLLLAGHPSSMALVRHAWGQESAPSRVLRLRLAPNGLPEPADTVVYDSDGVETGPGAVAAASVMAVWRAPDGRARWLVGAILSRRMLLCDEAP